jgi:hypothetical protein
MYFIASLLAVAYVCDRRGCYDYAISASSFLSVPRDVLNDIFRLLPLKAIRALQCACFYLNILSAYLLPQFEVTPFFNVSLLFLEDYFGVVVSSPNFSPFFPFLSYA